MTHTIEQLKQDNPNPKWKQDACMWCAEGDKASVNNGRIHKIYPMTAGGGFKHPSITSALSQYFACTAPTEIEHIEQLTHALATVKVELAEARRDTERLKALSNLLEDDSGLEIMIARRRDGQVYVSDSNGSCVSGTELEIACDQLHGVRIIDAAREGA